MTFIYCLTDPRSGEIRYVGKSNNPVERLRHHLKDKTVCHRTVWLAKLSRDGLRPIVVPLEECSEEVWQERERHWIAFLRKNGADLVNDTDGGDGVTGHSPELRAKMSAAMKGRPARNKGKHHTPETLERLSASHMGKPMLPQTRAAIAKANIGQDHQRHRDDNTMLEYHGLRASIYEWMEKFKVGRTVILKRLMRGWSIEDAIETPKRIYQRKE